MIVLPTSAIPNQRHSSHRPCVPRGLVNPASLGAGGRREEVWSLEKVSRAGPRRGSSPLANLRHQLESTGDKTMPFGLNRAEVIGRLGADATISNLASGGRVANMSIATDESYIDRQSGERVDRTEWHRAVSFQSGLIDMLEKHAKKGRLVYVAGKLQTSRSGARTARTRTGSRPRSCSSPVAACSFWIAPPGPTATARRRPTRRSPPMVRPRLQIRTERFRSN